MGRNCYGPKCPRSTTQEVKSEINRLQDLRVEVELSWSPGHANIKGNELADQQAKEAAHFQVLGGGVVAGYLFIHY